MFSEVHTGKRHHKYVARLQKQYKVLYHIGSFCRRSLMGHESYAERAFQRQISCVSRWNQLLICQKISLFVLGLKWAPLGPSTNAMVLIHDGRQKFSTSIFNLYDHFSTTNTLTYVQETKLLMGPCWLLEFPSPVTAQFQEAHTRTRSHTQMRARDWGKKMEQGKTKQGCRDKQKRENVKVKIACNSCCSFCCLHTVHPFVSTLTAMSVHRYSITVLSCDISDFCIHLMYTV